MVLVDMDSETLIKRLENFLKSSKTHLPGIIEPDCEQPEDSEEILNTTVLDPDDFDRLLKEVSGENEEKKRQNQADMTNNEDTHGAALLQLCDSSLNIASSFPESKESNQVAFLLNLLA
ncbi:hypothetical protein DSO57_1011678 [Entomophthora muscae]|uniref:Uncharacterized protein n=1 Tax=Entomophthora muscae TaxID=34485 RepID=A0ACC2RX46_9FUNG|nr:hypothetical protein DSO57_1011678 [Entomophthora muscae]